MKLELIMVGTCEVCGYQASSSDVMGVIAKIKECEDKGAGSFKFKIGSALKLVCPDGEDSGLVVVGLYHIKLSHTPCYVLESSSKRRFANTADYMERHYRE